MPYQTRVALHALVDEPGVYVAEEVDWEGYHGVRRRAWHLTRAGGRTWTELAAAPTPTRVLGR